MKAALRRLAEIDPDIARAIAAVGHPPARIRPAGFEGLARIVVAQQISAQAAASLWRRLEAALAPCRPDEVVRRSHDELRALGLSRQKALYLRAIADEILSGRLNLDRVHALDDAAAIAALTQMKGIGQWSAEIYLLFSLRRRDVFPAGDLALQVAVQRLKGLRKRPDPDRLRRLAEPWRPYRSAAAHLLWHYYAKT